MEKHSHNCPRTQFWDGGEYDVSCSCSNTNHCPVCGRFISKDKGYCEEHLPIYCESKPCQPPMNR